MNVDAWEMTGDELRTGRLWEDDDNSVLAACNENNWVSLVLLLLVNPRVVTVTSGDEAIGDVARLEKEDGATVAVLGFTVMKALR